MICTSCKEAGDLNALGQYGSAVVAHTRCTNCECQHATGAQWTAKDGVARS